MVRLDVQRGQVLRAVAEGAVAADVRRSRVDEVAALQDVGDVAAGVRAAARAGRGAEEGGLAWRADDLHRGEGGSEDSADPVGRRVDVVHPVAPEGGELVIGADHAVEDGEGHEEEREDLSGACVSISVGKWMGKTSGFRNRVVARWMRCDRRGWENGCVGWKECGGTYIRDDGETARESSDPLAPTSHEQEEQNRHDIRIAGGPAISWQTSRPVPQHPIDGRRQDRHGDLGNDLCSAEREPAICPRWMLPCFP